MSRTQVVRGGGWAHLMHALRVQLLRGVGRGILRTLRGYAGVPLVVLRFHRAGKWPYTCACTPYTCPSWDTWPVSEMKVSRNREHVCQKPSPLYLSWFFDPIEQARVRSSTWQPPAPRNSVHLNESRLDIRARLRPTLATRRAGAGTLGQFPR